MKATNSTEVSDATNSVAQQLDNPLEDGQACPPLLNMAFDSWMAEFAPLEPQQSILRIYRWSPGGISIGRNQLWRRALDLDTLSGGEVAVRRITGGRAIYHDPHEVTYSFVTQMQQSRQFGGDASQNDGRDSLVAAREISELIVQSLLRFLLAIGVDAQVEKRVGFVPAHRADRQSPHCFVSTARHEITFNGRKIVASAQRVKDGRFFQHGSIKLFGAIAHPALYNRPSKQSSRAGNNFTPNERYIVEGDVADSHFSDSPIEISPCELRNAFTATFGGQLTPPNPNPRQWEEVSRQIADIDYIVGAAGLGSSRGHQFTGLSVTGGQVGSNDPHSPHGNTPHKNNANLAKAALVIGTSASGAEEKVSRKTPESESKGDQVKQLAL